MKSKEYLRAWRRTPAGYAHKMWNNMKLRCLRKDRPKEKAYKDVEIKMTKEEFYEWVIPEVELFLKNNPDKTPSVDRKESKGHYELTNLRIICFKENSRQSTARIESAFSKMAELYAHESESVKQEKLNEFIEKAKQTMGMQ